MAFSGRPYSSSVGFIPKFGPFNLLNSLSCNPLVIGLVCISVLLLNTSVANAYTSLHPLEYKRLLSISKVHELLDPFNKDGLLEPILQERVPDTDGSRNVQKHIRSFFQQQNNDLASKFGSSSSYINWSTEIDTFQNDTPSQKNVTFTNLIFTRNPPGAQAGSTGYLTLVAHYDSKIEPKGFIGAIDSAVPCAIMMHIAKVLDESLTNYWKANYVAPTTEASTAPIQSVSELGLQLIFLDGEEAYVEWTDTDSTYGARHLASEWEQRGVFHASVDGKDATSHGSALSRVSKLEEIDAFVLMDLIGAKDTVIQSYYENTDWLHKHLNQIEKVYRTGLNTKKSALKGTNHRKRNENPGQFFPRSNPFSYKLAEYLSDDHLPFLHRGVPILHLIPLPFPSVWHKIEDDADHLDRDSIDLMSHIMTAFVAEYMGITGHLGVDIRNSDL